MAENVNTPGNWKSSLERLRGRFESAGEDDPRFSLYLYAVRDAATFNTFNPVQLKEEQEFLRTLSTPPWGGILWEKLRLWGPGDEKPDVLNTTPKQAIYLSSARRIGRQYSALAQQAYAGVPAEIHPTGPYFRFVNEQADPPTYFELDRRPANPALRWSELLFWVLGSYSPGLIFPHANGLSWILHNGNVILCRLAVNPFVASAVAIDAILSGQYGPSGGQGNGEKVETQPDSGRNEGGWSEPMTLEQLGRVFNVHRNQVRKLVLDKYAHVSMGARHRMKVSDLPPDYQQLAGLEEKRRKRKEKKTP